jgi:hypothetical protein
MTHFLEIFTIFSKKWDFFRKISDFDQKWSKSRKNDQKWSFFEIFGHFWEI